MIAIVDYGMGNVRSVERAFAAVGARAVITADPDELSGAERIVLPGVGAFGTAMERLRSSGLADLLTELVVDKATPFLGICLGMQLICTGSTEHGEHQGLGWIDTEVRRLEPGEAGLRVPHTGWNDVTPVPGAHMLPDPGVFYFVHSYCVGAEQPHVSAICNYGTPFAAGLEHENIWTTQFHPEKSQAAGLELLERFVALKQAPATV